MSLHGEGSSSSTDCMRDMLASFHARFECQKARDKVRIALENYEKFNVQVVERMDRRIASFRHRIRELQDYLYDYGGPSEYYEDLEDLKEELYECRIQQRENNSHALCLAQKWQEEQLYLDSLETQSLPKETECVTLEFDVVQSKVCDHSNLVLDVDLPSIIVQHVEIENMCHETISREDLYTTSRDCMEPNSEPKVESLENTLVNDDMGCSVDTCVVTTKVEFVIPEPKDEFCHEDVLEQVQIPDFSAPLLLENKEDNHINANVYVVEEFSLVPSTLQVLDAELIGGIADEIEPEPPPVFAFKLLDFVDPMFQASCHLFHQDLRANLLQGGGDDTPINAYGNVDNLEDHKSLYKEESEAQQAAVQQPHSTMDRLENFEESYKCLGPEIHLYEPRSPKNIISHVEN